MIVEARGFHRRLAQRDQLSHNSSQGNALYESFKREKYGVKRRFPRRTNGDFRPATNRKSHTTTSFRLVPVSMTFNDLE